MIGFRIAFLLILALAAGGLRAQGLRPGFDKAEYIRLMHVSAQFGDSGYAAKTPAPEGYRRVYRAQVVGLENLWEFWTDAQGRGIVSIRGTTVQPVSWLANVYAAMVPARGSLQLAADRTFDYDLAADPKAAVHVGWLVALGFMAPDMLSKIDSSYRKGMRSLLVVGHSQGGAIAYLLTAHLRRLQLTGKLLKDLQLKTYCSAGPKPGNLYFAYEYETMTQAGWAYNVVNAADWVPQTPFSVQTVDDFPDINPFKNAKSMIRTQKGSKRWVLRHIYRQLTRPSRKAVKNYQKYLGKFASRSAGKSLDGFSAPQYYNSNDYVRTGATIVMMPDSGYFRRYPNTDKNRIFIHHFHPPYLYLAERLPIGQAEEDYDTAVDSVSIGYPLDGLWQLKALPGAKVPKGGRIPALTFDMAHERISGNTGCNSFSGTVKLHDERFHLVDSSLVMTKMFCPGGADDLFLGRLKSATRYKIEGTYLTLYKGEEPVMLFDWKEQK